MAISDTCGQQSTYMLAFTVELGGLNRQGTNLDVEIEILFMQSIE